MPELPEVEIIRLGLEPLLKNKTIDKFWCSGKSLRCAVPQKEISRLNGSLIVSLERRAKYIIINLRSGEQLIFHLGMTGNLGTFPAGTPRRTHDHLEWQLNDEKLFRFHDPRRFGSLTLLDGSNEARTHFFRNCGPEPLLATFNAGYLKKCASKRSIAIKPFIMTNQIVVGLGNIYANESLFKAGIQPARKVSEITEREWQHLVTSIRKTLAFAIECGGSTISDFRNAQQQSGYFQMNFKVYGRTGEPCLQCGTEIKKIVLGGRTSFYCPKCQR